MKCNHKFILQSVCASGVIFASSAVAPHAQAADQISLSYQGSEVSVTRQELESFTDTGILPPSIQELLGIDDRVPPVIRTLLSQEIKVPSFVEKFLDSSTGEFVLNQLDDTIRSTSGRTEQDLFDLKTAFNNAASDDRISFIELVRRYPQSNVSVDLTSLESTYNRVSNFVERVQPALEVAKGFLSDVICDCNTASAPSSLGTLNASTETLHTSDGQPCNTAITDDTTDQQIEAQAKDDGLKISQSAQ